MEARKGEAMAAATEEEATEAATEAAMALGETLVGKEVAMVVAKATRTARLESTTVALVAKASSKAADLGVAVVAVVVEQTDGLLPKADLVVQKAVVTEKPQLLH